MLAHGVLFARYLVPWDDEAGYLVLGAMAARGEVTLFQDDMMGERLPLPFYLLGLVQLVTGPDLLAARLASLALGAGVLVLVYAVGRRLAGPVGGVLSAALLATQAMIVGYYATAMYHAMNSLLIAGGLYLYYVAGSRLGAMVAFSLLSLMRPNLAVMVPLVLAYLMWGARSRRERALLVLIAALPPVLFFVSDPRHLKILAYVPVLNHLVRSLGYESLFNLGGHALAATGRSWPEGVAWFLRRYFFWCAAAVGLLAATMLWRGRSGHARPPDTPSLTPLGVLLAYTLVWQGLILFRYPKSIAAWSASFAPLAALWLGGTAARLLEPGAVPLWTRRLLAGGLTGMLLLSPRFSTHAAMPNPLPPEPTVRVLQGLADDIAERVPPGSRVFLYGSALPAYLAGAKPYPQQVIHAWTLVPRGTPAMHQRSGLWSFGEIDAWLGGESRYAILEPALMTSVRRVPGYDRLMERIEGHLAARFVLVGTLSRYPLTTYLVYRRREPSR